MGTCCWLRQGRRVCVGEKKEKKGKGRVAASLDPTDASDWSGSGSGSACDSIHFPEAKISPKIQGVVES